MKKISLGSWAFSFGPFADHPIPFEKTVLITKEKRYNIACSNGIKNVKTTVVTSVGSLATSIVIPTDVTSLPEGNRLWIGNCWERKV